MFNEDCQHPMAMSGFPQNTYIVHEYIVSINIMVITNIEMTTQYIQDKTSHTHTHTHTRALSDKQL